MNGIAAMFRRHLDGLVLCGGQVSGIVDGRGTTKEEVGLLMTRFVKEGKKA